MRRLPLSSIVAIGLPILVLVGMLTARAPAGADAAPVDQGVWGAPFTPPNAVTAVHMALMHNGKVLMFGEEGVTAIWNPNTNTTTRVPFPGPIFCGGHTILADGRIFSAGGRTVGIKGPRITAVFDPTNQTWSTGPDMAAGRYYPTTTTLADRRVLITGGTDEAGNPNDDAEVYTPGAPGQPGTLEHVGDQYDSWYPHVFVLPDSKIGLVSRSQAWRINPSGWGRTLLPKPRTRSGQKSGVLLPGGTAGSSKVLIAGGLSSGGLATATTQQIDFSAPAPAWMNRAAMPQPRHNMNLVTLPDGMLLGVGGNGQGKDFLPELSTLMYDPAGNTWRTMATQALRRAYHSTALLLPDGRVLSAGDNRPGGGKLKLEIYSPPYLFRGARPVITSATSQVANGGQIAVQTASQVSRAVLMAPGSTTHANDMHQRHVELAVTTTGGGITAQVPGAGVAPPGYYMLFILNSSGVPSVASWVKVG